MNISGISLNDWGREFGIFQVRAEFSQVRVSGVTVLLGVECGVWTDKQIIGLNSQVKTLLFVIAIFQTIVAAFML